MLIGDIMKTLRQRKALTQKELSEILDIVPSTIGMYEQNRRNPDLETLVKIAQFFDVSTDYLLTGKERTSSPVAEVPEEDKEILNIWHTLNDEGKKSLLKQGNFHLLDDDYVKKESKKRA